MNHLGNKDYDTSRNYNLIMMRNFLLIVMRKAEGVNINGSLIKLNSLGYAGTLAVTNEKALEDLKSFTPIKLLEALAES